MNVCGGDRADYAKQPLLSQLWTGLDEVLSRPEYARLTCLLIELVDWSVFFGPSLEANMRASMPRLHDRGILLAMVLRPVKSSEWQAAYVVLVYSE